MLCDISEIDTECSLYKNESCQLQASGKIPDENQIDRIKAPTQ